MGVAQDGLCSFQLPFWHWREQYLIFLQPEHTFKLFGDPQFAHNEIALGSFFVLIVSSIVFNNQTINI